MPPKRTANAKSTKTVNKELAQAEPSLSPVSDSFEDNASAMPQFENNNTNEQGKNNNNNNNEQHANTNQNTTDVSENEIHNNNKNNSNNKKKPLTQNQLDRGVRQDAAALIRKQRQAMNRAEHARMFKAAREEHVKKSYAELDEINLENQQQQQQQP